MKRRTVIAMLLTGAVAAGCAGFPGSGWETLIDGNAGLDNFNRLGDANWRPDDGAIVADKGKGGFLVTKKSYRDFQIRAEFYAETTTNSGIFMRAQDPQKIAAATSYEVNVFDLRPEQKYGTGAIVDVAAVNPMPKAGGRWNTFEITAQGNRLIVVMNGQQTVDVRDGKFVQGPFALQFANGPKDAPGGAIKWRKVMIKPL
jgi:hypothetical protein